MNDTIADTPVLAPTAQARHARLAEVLACPSCHHPLRDTVVCPSCGTAGRRSGAQLRFGGFESGELKADALNRVKEFVKTRFHRLYPTAIKLLSPVMNRPGAVRGFLKSFDLDRDVVADFGCGTHRRDERIVCMDGGSYGNVDIVTDLRRLPLADNSLAGGVSIAVLEHVPDPAAHIAEMHRVLKPGGRMLVFVPFMQPFHASPYDFQRYTEVGLKEQFPQFEVLSVKPGAGPTSGMVWVLQEWLAMLLSFGSAKLYRLVLPLTWLLSPLKLLDLVMIHHPMAAQVASGFVIEVRKPA
ncbi:methyltransferase domain-containing protein [Dactylosporangium sp. AC04546]|uniref:methyltransferase domain-containing protein n=1 Tax=Dactylosporangium sp. AC04546 TaxID=2862460 RepID=UPI001EDED9D3|nr:methyltransferase domain-containing protein [Dactylosporangium sp. AC04546]WVK85453.1 methyltransferase domain-containing protein [Dactylosporangium sp. AC04546]